MVQTPVRQGGDAEAGPGVRDGGPGSGQPHPRWMAEAGLTDAERDEVELCLDYDEYYGHGRPGRFHMIIIAKLARHIREGRGCEGS